MPRKISSATSADTLRKQARRWMKALGNGDADARARFERAYPGAPRQPVLRDVQHALAREYGHESWKALLEAVAAISVHVEPPPDRPLLPAEDYEALARDCGLAFNSRDESALDRLNRYYQRSFTFDDLWAEIWRRVYSFRQRAFRAPQQILELDEARSVLAQDAGFSSWAALLDASRTGAPAIPAFATTHLRIALPRGGS